MLSKFSVKKPYTVVVGIVLIIILGIVSFRDMTVDLLPSMNLPYAIVMTTYPGACLLYTSMECWASLDLSES